VERDPLSHVVIGAAIAVHRELGPGLLESVYEACLAQELQTRRVPFARGIRIPVVYGGVTLRSCFRLDLLVAEELVVELKSVEHLMPVHLAQVLTYLKLTGHRRALLINFNVPRLLDGVKRLVL
jgi:GxxExxY protein